MRAFVWLFFALLSFSVEAATLSVRVDRETLYEDETLVMSVHLRDGSAGDFSPKLDDFDILQRSQSSQTQIINGDRTDSLSWEFVLAPKRSGTLQIPAFDIGGATSQALRVQVESLAARAQRPEDRPFFLKVSVSDSEPYVQQQVIYTMKLYQQQPITDGNVTEPDHADVQIERLGLDRSYLELVDGREYSVLERRYALFPQRSGEIVLPAINLNARVQVGQRSNRFFAPNTRSIRVRAQSLTLDVKAVNEAYKASWWLASTALQGEAIWEPEQAQLGEPLTLKIQLTAAGVMPAQIPVLDDPQVSGARLYSDGSRAAKKAGADGVISQRVSSWTIIPTQPGRLQITSFKVPWWDLESDQQRVLEIEVPELQIEGELPQGAAKATPEEADEGVEAVQTEPVPSDDQKISAQEEPVESEGWWLSGWHTQLVIVSLVAFAALVVRRRRRMPLPLQTDEQLCSPDEAMVRLIEAVTRADVKVGREAVLDWASGTFREPIRSLPQLAERLDDEEFSRLVLELDVICYRDKGRWSGEPLLEKLKAYKPPQRAVAANEDLPVLS